MTKKVKVGQTVIHANTHNEYLVEAISPGAAHLKVKSDLGTSTTMSLSFDGYILFPEFWKIK